MNKALEFAKKHPGAIAAGVVGLIVVVYLVSRGSSSGGSSGLTSAIASQQSGQLQMAQLNAQLSAQQSQTEAQLAATEYSGNLQQQEAQDTEAGQIVSSIIPAELEASLYSQELSGQQAEQSSLLPLEQTALNVSQQGGRVNSQTGENELAILLGAGNENSSLISAASALPQPLSNPQSGVGVTTPFGGLNITL